MTSRAHSRTVLALTAALALVTAGCTSEAPSAPSTAPTTTAGPTAAPSTEPPTTEPPATEAPSSALAEFGVSAGHPAAVEAGTAILRAGGSAADAAVAAAFAIAVVEPFASGIGGGGAAIVAPTGGEPEAYDYREVVGQDGVVDARGTGVPGFVAGMAELHEAHGRLPWADLLAPAVELAEGHPVSDFLALRMRSDYGPSAVADLPHYAPGGVPLAAGQELVQEELAATMRAIAEEGEAAFYSGALADDLAAAGIDKASLAAYEVVRSAPVRGPVGDLEVLAAPPALPGVALIQMLQVAEAAGAGSAEPGSAEYIEDLSTGWQVADASVQSVLGDPAFVDVPVEELTDPALNAELAAGSSASAGRDDGDVRAADLVPGNTTHLTVVDTDGLMVSMTNTITSFWGGNDARTVGGFFLNNQLSRFDSISSDANRAEPGRRSVSWSAPTVVVDGEGRPVLGLGSPGGRQIPNILANVLARWILHDQPLPDAVVAPRFHLEGATLTAEELPPDAEELSARGWTLRTVPVEDAVFGSVQALEVDHGSGRVTGAADTRREAAVEVGSP
ncbi:gamma-glutamyltransferase [Georgenia sp. M64]|uniref:gamma-glutamyltransferase n=1 Tax=Georgenia sp. M64 TaxID=3120520 RepID=UPI0030DE6886